MALFLALMSLLMAALWGAAVVCEIVLWSEEQTWKNPYPSHWWLAACALMAMIAATQ